MQQDLHKSRPVLIQLENVKKQYIKADVHALHSISLSIEENEFIAITGPSGSGKSTLLHLIGGIDMPDSGSIAIENITPETLDQWTRLRAEKIGFVFQAFHLLPTLTAQENVEIPLHGQEFNSRVRSQKAEQLLTKVGLGSRLNHLPSELSGGEKQRVAIARSLANSPSILLADEPTGNLDTKTSEEILAIFQQIHKEEETTIILVTHDQNIARIASRNIRIVDGRVVSDERV